MNDSKQEDVLLNENGMVQVAIKLDAFLIVTKICCSFIGLPPNIFLAMIIIRFRRLHSKPRNVFLLGIIFANLMAFVPALIELIYWNVPMESVCQAYVAIVGLPYAILLLTILFALGDRFVAISYPLWHKKKVTVNHVVSFLILSILSLTFLLKFVYITGIAPLRCEVRFSHGKVIGWSMVVLLLLCIIIHFIVYRRTKTLLRESKNISHSSLTDLKKRTPQKPDEGRIAKTEINLELVEFPKPASQNKSGNVEELNHAKIDDTGMFNVNHSTSMVIHVNRGVLSKMEMEATRTLIAGVASLFLMTCPLMLYFITIFSCRKITQSECSTLSSLAPYFKEIGLVHAVYNPLIYLFRNNELWTVLKNIIISCSTQNDN